MVEAEAVVQQEHLAQQVEELECLQSMFPGDDELVMDPYVRALYESAGAAPGAEPLSLPPLRLVLRFKDYPVDHATPELHLEMPPAYPDALLAFDLRCPTLSRQEKQSIVERLTTAVDASAGSVVAFELYQAVQEILQEIIADVQVDLPPPPEQPQAPPVVGRRAIYFHHIIATSKRRVVIEWAKELGLGGYSKIGWPGVIIAEGPEPHVAEYIRRLQHLRWKQMVVRGEQVEDDANAPRRLPRPLTELSDMSVLAALCEDAGVSELFLTTMKIYR
ncbi:conserved protein with YSHH motif SOme fused to polo box [Achlya hypogyna]|uniref:Conserved protein with YSHH motif SOme fused to polo box n=1 Tax=Achlya hypogyna TaxID=1202772 RepID=A0A1V9Y9M9_ACHHY|nr:conserved protein with YSHH motif SOme fused to polo box [Achlya hypogyna]